MLQATARSGLGTWDLGGQVGDWRVTMRLCACTCAEVREEVGVPRAVQEWAFGLMAWDSAEGVRLAKITYEIRVIRAVRLSGVQIQNFLNTIRVCEVATPTGARAPWVWAIRVKIFRVQASGIRFYVEITN